MRSLSSTSVPSSHRTLSHPLRRPSKLQKRFTLLSALGFCQFTGHDIPVELQADLVKCSQQFFALPEAEKSALHVKNGGVACRWYAPLGGESTHGRTDWKEAYLSAPSILRTTRTLECRFMELINSLMPVSLGCAQLYRTMLIAS